MVHSNLAKTLQKEDRYWIKEKTKSDHCLPDITLGVYVGYTSNDVSISFFENNSIAKDKVK